MWLTYYIYIGAIFIHQKVTETCMCCIRHLGNVENVGKMVHLSYLKTDDDVDV